MACLLKITPALPASRPDGIAGEVANDDDAEQDDDDADSEDEAETDTDDDAEGDESGDDDQDEMNLSLAAMEASVFDDVMSQIKVISKL